MTTVASADGGRIAVVALGGNALSPAGERSTIHDQFRHTRESLGPIVELVRDGWNVCIVHGNGPQVGDELVRNEEARDSVEPLPLGVLVAGTAGWIGYMIQQSLGNALRAGGVDRGVATVVTQVVVREDDPALANPRKFVGHALSAERAEQLAQSGIAVARDGNGRTRRVVGSPTPVGVHEEGEIRRLLEGGTVVVALGGGGVPVYVDASGNLEGVDCVVDKDLAAAVLATDSHRRRRRLRRLGDAVAAPAPATDGGGCHGARHGSRARGGEHGTEGARVHRLRAPDRRPCHYYRAFSRPRRGRRNRGDGDRPRLTGAFQGARIVYYLAYHLMEPT